jgi:hypothetical protein
VAKTDEVGVGVDEFVELLHRNQNLSPQLVWWALESAIWVQITSGTQPKMGRHARPTQKTRQLVYDLICYAEVNDMRKNQKRGEQKVTWVAAFENVGLQLGIGGEAARKAYYRAKKVVEARSSGIKPNNRSK